MDIQGSGMKHSQKPSGAIMIVVFLTLVIVVSWFAMYGLYLARA